MTQPISVVIPCRNHERWVVAAARSATQAAEIVIHDDASTDLSWVNSDNLAWMLYDESFTDVRLMHQSFRTGVCFGRNIMIFQSHHEFILPLDADDQLYPDAIDRLYAKWQPGTWVYGNHTEIDEDGHTLREVEAPPPGMLHRKNLTYATFLFHKDDWRRAGGYDPTFEIGCEDYAFQIALTANGVRPVKVDGAPIYKRMIHSQSRTSAAVEHFPILQSLMRRRWPSAFQTNRS